MEESLEENPPVIGDAAEPPLDQDPQEVPQYIITALAGAVSTGSLLYEEERDRYVWEPQVVTNITITNPDTGDTYSFAGSQGNRVVITATPAEMADDELEGPRVDDPVFDIPYPEIYGDLELPPGS